MKKEYRYTFPIVLTGTGTIPDEAWQDAIEAFELDEGNYDEAIKEEEI